VLMLGDNPETGEDVALKLVQEGFAKVRLRFLSPVLRIRNRSYECGSIIMNHGSRSSRPINYGPDPDPV
jgi:hypothetical protein